LRRPPLPKDVPGMPELRQAKLCLQFEHTRSPAHWLANEASHLRQLRILMAGVSALSFNTFSMGSSWAQYG
jgi:hypothetical protein